MSAILDANLFIQGLTREYNICDYSDSLSLVSMEVQARNARGLDTELGEHGLTPAQQSGDLSVITYFILTRFT